MHHRDQCDEPNLLRGDHGAERIRRALPHIKAEDLIIAPDCGLKYLPRDAAFGKLKSMVAGAQLVRKQLQNAVS